MQKIGAEAFENCTALKEIIIPADCTDIGKGAFRHCKRLQPNKNPLVKDYLFDCKTVVLTGRFKNVKRDTIKSQLTSLGCFVRGSISGKTDYIIAGSAPAPSVIAEAKQLQLRIVTEEEYLAELEKVGLSAEQITVSGNISLAGKTFVITGTLSIKRSEAKQLIENNGGKVTGSISSKTDYPFSGRRCRKQTLKSQIFGN